MDFRLQMIVEDIRNIIVEQIRKREVITPLIFKDTTTDIRVQLDDVIELSPEYSYEIGLKALSTSYSMPNIDVHNNVLRYSTDQGKTYQDLVLEVGSYEIAELKTVIDHKLKASGHFDPQYDKAYIGIEGNPGSGRTEVTIRHKDYMIDFAAPNSIGSIFGFAKKQIGYGYNVSDGLAMINPLNTILVHCNLVNGTRYNGKSIQSLYEFTPRVPPGYKMYEQVANPTFVPVSNAFGSIQNIRIWLTDEDLKILNLRGEEITIVLLLRKY